MRAALRKLGAGVVIMVVAVAGASGLEAVREGHGATTAQKPTVAMAQTRGAPPVASDTSAPAALSQAFRYAAKSALPGVVYIEVEGTARPQATRGNPFGDLFPRGNSDPVPQRGSGSGFIFRQDGYILTNNHVVDNADRVTVTLQDNREFKASVVGRDPNTDVAVIKIDASNLPVVALGESDPLEVGDWVVALGYPLSLGSTATAGIVSAKGRAIGILSQDNSEASAPLEHFIQTDAAINPGNSGGPLVDLRGRAIGINSAIASPTGFYSGYGFAIPMSIARRVSEDLIKYGEVHRPKLGVRVSDLSPADAEVYGLSSMNGAEIGEVTPDSPAERAGIQIGDVVIGLNGKPVNNGGDLTESLSLYQPGDKVTLDLYRDRKKMSVDVKLGEFEPGARVARNDAAPRVRGMDRLGFSVADLTPQLARRAGLASTEGVVVTDVDQNGMAYRNGIAPTEVIEKFNGQAVKSAADLERLADAVKPGQAVSLVVRLPNGTRNIINYRVAG